MRVSYDDYDLAARQIMKLKDDPELCRKMGNNSKRLAASVFDRRKMAARCEGIMLDVLKEAGRT